MQKIDITGNKYGRLTVIRENGKNGKNIIWLCKCDCGKEVSVIAYNLKNGHTRSCGCFQKESKSNTHSTHKCSNSRLYRIWIHIKNRCLNAHVPHYKYYGGRGIKVCPEWEKSFVSFMNWSLSNGYKDGLSIDRINVNGNYDPDNCRWVDMKIQANNKTNNRIIEYNGEKKTLSLWADEKGIKRVTLQKRIFDYGWDIEKALTTPVRGLNH